MKKGKWDLKNIEVEKFNELEVRTVRQKYGQALGWTGFCGGTETFSYWVYRQDLLAVLKELGFINIRINFDKIDHPNGPCFAIIASKFDTTYYLDPSVNPDLSEVVRKTLFRGERITSNRAFQCLRKKRRTLAYRSLSVKAVKCL